MDMGTFDHPFDADRRLRNGGCPCGGHANRSEHDRASPDRPECSAIDGEEAGYETVVAAAAMRAIFPKDAVRRAFLKSVGASTALAALAQFFPLATATEVFARRAGEEGPQGRLYSNHLRNARHHGAPDGLLFQAGAERRGGQVRGLGGRAR